MTTQFNEPPLAPKQAANYGFAIVRDIAFDAVRSLWSRRQAEGMTQADLAAKIGRDPGWVSRNLRAPGNWTLRTFGELVFGLDGETSIAVSAVEDALESDDLDAYHGYLPVVYSQVEAFGVVIRIADYATNQVKMFAGSDSWIKVNFEVDKLEPLRQFA